MELADFQNQPFEIEIQIKYLISDCSEQIGKPGADMAVSMWIGDMQTICDWNTFGPRLNSS